MDDGSTLLSLLEDLDEQIDGLSDALSPLFSASLTSTTEKLPALDRARLYTLLVYSIESLLFSSLRLSNTDPQSHPVFAELARVKKYFAKISAAEAGPTKPRENLSVNKEAAARVIKHALSGNPSSSSTIDQAQALANAKARVLSKRKLHVLQDHPDSPYPITNSEATESSRPSKVPRTSESFLVERSRPTTATNSPQDTTEANFKSEDGEISDQPGSGASSIRPGQTTGLPANVPSGPKKSKKAKKANKLRNPFAAFSTGQTSAPSTGSPADAPTGSNPPMSKGAAKRQRRAAQAAQAAQATQAAVPRARKAKGKAKAKVPGVDELFHAAKKVHPTEASDPPKIDAAAVLTLKSEDAVITDGAPFDFGSGSTPSLALTQPPANPIADNPTSYNPNSKNAQKNAVKFLKKQRKLQNKALKADQKWKPKQKSTRQTRREAQERHARDHPKSEEEKRKVKERSARKNVAIKENKLERKEWEAAWEAGTLVEKGQGKWEGRLRSERMEGERINAGVKQETSSGDVGEHSDEGGRAVYQVGELKRLGQSQSQ